MTRILVDLESLRGTARAIRQSGETLRALSQKSGQVYQGLAWEAHRRADVEERIASALNEAERLFTRSTEFAEFLEHKATAYQEADSQSSAQLGDLSTRYPDLTATSGGATVGTTAPQAGSKQGPDTSPAAAKQEPDTSPAGAKPPSFDGLTPAPGTTNMNIVVPLTPPLTNLPGNRSAAVYNDVLNQFAVANNPRYTPRDTDGRPGDDTFCNFFVWDATSAMGAEVPHWVSDNNEPADPGQEAHELNANGVANWLDTRGPGHGWRRITAEEAQAAANQGHPTVAAYNSHSGAAGHVAMVRPGTYTAATGPTIAQAGEANYNETTVSKGFGSYGPVYYYTHD